MFHFFEAIQNTKGDALVGYFVQVIDPASLTAVNIYADNSATPIVSVSGVANMALVNSDGDADFYVAPGTYNLNIYAPDAATLVKTISNWPMGLNSITLASGSAVSTIAQLQAVSLPVNGQSAILADPKLGGEFVFSTANLSAKVAIDTLQGIYVAPTSDTTGASGAWVRKFDGLASWGWFGLAADGVTDDTTVLNTAQTILASLGGTGLQLPEGVTCKTTATFTFSANNLTYRGNGSTISSTLDGKAFAFNGNSMDVSGFHFDQAATGADPAPYAEVNGTGNNIHDNTWTRSATAHVPFYVRTTASGFRFRNNICTWYGGINIFDCANGEITGCSFINPTGTASDDAIAIKATVTYSRNWRITNNYFEGMADFVGIGSEIGTAGANDSTHSRYVSGIVIKGNTGKNCGAILLVKPCAIDGVDYRDGTVRGIVCSNNVLIDDSGTNMTNGIVVKAGRGARVYSVTGKNNVIYGRVKTGASNLYGQYIYLRDDTGVGSAASIIDKVDVGVEIIDPYDGAAAGGSAPGSPFTCAIRLEKQTTAVGTASNIVIDAMANGIANSAVSIGAGYDNAVLVRRFTGTNLVANGSSSFAGIVTSSAITIDSEISMTMASGSSGLQYIISGGSITSLLPKQMAAVSLIGNATNAQANATQIAAASDGQVMRRASGALAFGAVDLTSANAVSGALQAANFPALTGAITTPGGSLTTTLSSSAAVAAIAGQAIAPASVAATGAVTSSGTAGMGYATGAGGTVTQATSKTNGVTLNKLSGTITMNNAALAAGNAAAFVVSNSLVAATDTIILNIASGAASNTTYRPWISQVAAGSFTVVIENRSGGSLSEALVLNYSVLKAVAA
jgi:hypothetical protein